MDKNLKELERIENLEKKYFKEINSCLDKSSKNIMNKIKLIGEIKDDWIKFAFEKKTNIVDKSAERIIRQELLRGLNWDYLGVPISSDECFSLNDAVVHIDVKTQLATERFDVENPNEININKVFIFKNLIASQNQITLLPKDNIPFSKAKNGMLNWEPHIPTYYTFKNSKKPCLTYFVRLVYSLSCPHCGLIQNVGPKPQEKLKEILDKKKIKDKICVPFGKLEYSKNNSCKKSYSIPSYRLEEVVTYCVPNGELIKEFYDSNWFQVNMPYKSPVKEDGKIIGISSARIILRSFTNPTKVPQWWKTAWDRTYRVKIQPIEIIKGD